MKLKLIIFTVFLIIPCWGSVDTIRQLLYSLLNQPRNGSVVSAEKFFSQINENTVRSLSSTDVRQLLPLAKRCLQSPILDVRRDGLLLLMAINLRDDGSILLEPFSSNLELMVTDSADPLRHGVIYVLANITPDASSNIGAFLTAHLEDKYNSMGDRLVIASSLVKF